MRLSILVAGSGALHCGACLRDLAFARGLLARGHDVTVVPLYLPLGPPHGDLPTAAVAMDGINAWLQQASGLFRRTPRWLDRCLGARPLLRLAGRLAGATRADGLGPLTVSMLRGAGGNQRKQVEELVAVLRPLRPEIIVISNALLLGVAPELRRGLGVPLVCGLQGEESFVDGLGDPWRGEALALLREQAACVPLFLAPHAAHAIAGGAWLGLDPSRVAVLPTAFDPRRFHPDAPPLPEPQRLGWLAPLIARKGPDLLLTAAAALPAELRRNLRLVLAGQQLDRGLLRHLRRQAAEAGLAVEFPGPLDEAAKPGFLRSLHAFAVASRTPEARGLAGLEALACGIPLLAPADGAFPDLAALGGVGLFRPGDAADLARALAVVLADPAASRASAARAAAALPLVHGQTVVGERAEALLTALLPPR